MKAGLISTWHELTTIKGIKAEIISKDSPEQPLSISISVVVAVGRYP